MRSDSERPSLSTDHAITTSNLPRVASFAALTMRDDLQMSASAYEFALGASPGVCMGWRCSG